jgi:carboxyl-terminal processing protease
MAQRISAACKLGLLLATVHLFWSAASHAQELRPTDKDRTATRKALEFIQQQHILKREFGRDSAGKALDAYIALLDRSKLYFLQEDIAEFNRRKRDLAEELQEGDVSVAFDVFARYRQRVDEADQLCKQLIMPATAEFTAKEVIIIDPKAREFAKDATVRRELWRAQIRYELLLMKTDPKRTNFDAAMACEELSASYARGTRGVRIAKGYQVLEWFLNSVGGIYDNGTTYTSPATIETYNENMRGNFVGIGVIIANDNSVGSIIPGGPADSDGRLKVGDRFINVGQGESGQTVDITRLTVNEFVAMIRGPEGSTVRLGIRRPAETPLRTIALRRGKVFVPENKVQSRIEFASGRKVGHLDVPAFYVDNSTNDSTSNAVRKQLEKFRDQSVEVVVLDLRRCTGGQLDQAIALAGLFVGQGPICQVKQQSGQAVTQKNDGTAMA